MKFSEYLYNNEALGSIALAHFMSIHQSLPISKAMLVLPLVLHEPTMRHLKSKVKKKRSLEEFVIDNFDGLVNFDARYRDYLPLSVNVITILAESKVINVDRENIHFTNESEIEFSRIRSLGSRAQDVFLANESLSELMKLENASAFYLKLRVSL